jgi:hypothetical protein
MTSWGISRDPWQEREGSKEKEEATRFAADVRRRFREVRDSLTYLSVPKPKARRKQRGKVGRSFKVVASEIPGRVRRPRRTSPAAVYCTWDALVWLHMWSCSDDAVSVADQHLSLRL